MKTQEAFKKYFSTAYQGSKDFVQNVIFPILGKIITKNLMNTMCLQKIKI